jgi:peptidoglycan/LPS O-acetylase OafA/YrhL
LKQVPQPPQRLDSLTGLRAAAAGLVVALHVGGPFLDSSISIGVGSIAVSRLIRQGSVGVSFFFILSGFVMAWTARPDDRPRRFYRRRFARIWPSHLVTWLTWLVIVALGWTIITPTPARALVNLLLLQAWVPVGAWFFSINRVSWSLSCEEFFYAVFPMIRRRLALDDRRRRLVALVGLIAVTETVQLVITVVWPTPDTIVQYWAYIFPPTRLLEFMIGMVLAACVRHGELRVRRGPALAFAATAVLFASSFPAPFRDVGVTLIPFVLLIAASAHGDIAGTRSFWRTRTLVHLGEISFALYLVHDMVITVVNHLLLSSPEPDAVASAAYVALALGVSFIAAEVLHRRVERPWERRLRGTAARVAQAPTSDTSR